MELDVCVEKKEDEITQDHAKVQSQEEISRKVWASIKKTTPSNADLGFSAPPVLRGSSFCEEVDSLMMDRMSSNTERVLHKAHPSTSGPTVAWNVASLPTSGNLIEPSSNECSDTEDFEAVAEESKDCEGQGKKAGIKYSQDLGNEEGNILVQKVQTSFFKPHIIMVETCPAIARLFPTWQNDTEAQEEDDDEEAPEQISGPTVACSAEAHLPARGNSTKPSNNEVKEQEALAVDLEIEQEFTLERVSKEHKDCVGDGDKEDKVPVQPAETSYSKPAIAVVEIRRPTSGLSQAWQIDTEGQASEETVPCSKPAFPVIETLLPTAKPFQALKDITRKQEDEKPYSEIHSNIKSPDTEEFEAIAEESKDCEGQGKKAGIKYYQDLGNEEGNFLVQKVQTSSFKPHIIMVETCPATARLFPTWQNDIEAQEEDDDEEAPEQISGPTVACSAEAHLSARGNSTKPSNNEVKEQEALAVDLEIEQEFTLERVSKEHKDCVGDGDKEDRVPVQPAETSYSKPAIAVVEIRRPTAGPSQAWQNDTEGQASAPTVARMSSMSSNNEENGQESLPVDPEIEQEFTLERSGLKRKDSLGTGDKKENVPVQWIQSSYVRLPFQAWQNDPEEQEDEDGEACEQIPVLKFHLNNNLLDTDEVEAGCEENKDCESQGKETKGNNSLEAEDEEEKVLIPWVHASYSKPAIPVVEMRPPTVRQFQAWQNITEEQEYEDEEACEQTHVYEIQPAEPVVEALFPTARNKTVRKNSLGAGDDEEEVQAQKVQTIYSELANPVVETIPPTVCPFSSLRNNTRWKDSEGQEKIAVRKRKWWRRLLCWLPCVGARSGKKHN